MNIMNLKTETKPSCLVLLATLLQGIAACGGLDTHSLENTEITVSTTADVSGTVIDAVTEQPVSGATVLVADRSAATGSSGQFFIAKVRTGTQTLSVQHNDYGPFSTEVELVAGSNAVGALRLNRSGLDAGYDDASGSDSILDDVAEQDTQQPDTWLDAHGLDATGTDLWQPDVNEEPDAGIDDAVGTDTTFPFDAVGTDHAPLSDATTVDSEVLTGRLSIVEAPYSRYRTVTLTLDCQDAIWLQLSEDAAFIATTPQSCQAEIDYELTDGDGPKLVYARFAGAGGDFGPVFSATTTLDTVRPTPPVFALPASWTFIAEQDGSQVYTTDSATFSLELLTSSTDLHFSHHAASAYCSNTSTSYDAVLNNGTVFDFELPAQGRWSIDVAGFDLADNRGWDEQNVLLVWDTEAPVLLEQFVTPEATQVGVEVTLDEPARCEFEYATNLPYADNVVLDVNFENYDGTFTIGDRPFASSYWLKPLFPNTTYHYRISCEDAYGNQSVGNDSTFTTGSELSGEIANALVLTAARSPYFMTSDVLVHGDLTLEPGAVLLKSVDTGYGAKVHIDGNFNVGAGARIDDCDVDVVGHINVVGTAQAPVRLDSVILNPIGMTDDVNIAFAELIDSQLAAYTAYVGQQLRGAIQIRDSLLEGQWGALLYITCDVGCSFERNVFSDSYNVDIRRVGAAAVVFNNNYFDNAYNHRCYLTSSGEEFTAEYNSFMTSFQRALCLTSSGDLAAPNNFWDTTDPDVIATRIVDRNDGLLDYDNYIEFTPILTSPDSLTPTPVN